MKVSSRATVVYKDWTIQPKEIKELPKKYESEFKIKYLFEAGFIWPVDGLGYQIDKSEESEPEPASEPEIEEDVPNKDGNLFWKFAEDYLQRNARTVVKNLKSDKEDLTVVKLESLRMVEKNRKNPRKSVLKWLDELRSKFVD